MLHPHALRIARRSLTSTLLAAIALAPIAIAPSGCLPATNPCDPSADPSIRRTASIEGVVVDQSGAPVPGVPVFISGAGDSKVSGDDGTFVFDGLLPNDDGSNYEIIAVPQAPIAGGRAVASPLGCEETLTDVQVPVVVPPPSPEVEISQATAPDRLFVAFASAGENDVSLDDDDVLAAVDGCGLEESGLTYRIEVRAPFGAWHEAVLAKSPVMSGEAGALRDPDAPALVAPDEEVEPAVAVHTAKLVDDVCARATCAYYSYAYPSLAENENARCVEVVGLKDTGGVERPLSAYERYEVRVRADVHVEGFEQKALPRTVSSAASASPGELSLTPTAVLPVPMHDDPLVDEDLRAELDIQGAAPINKNRFALISGDGLMVVGGGTLDEEDVRDVMGTDPVTDDGMVVDDMTTAAASDEVANDNGKAVALLPAGKWVRVWKRRLNDSMIDKVFVGAFPGDVPAGAEGQQPIFDVNMLLPEVAESFRGFHWLARPEGTLTSGPYNPPDAYLLLFTKGVVVLERNAANSEDPAMMGGTTPDSIAGFYTTYDASLTSLCDAVNDVGVVPGAEGTTYGACWDVRSLNPDVELADTQILATHDGETSPSTTFHIFADAAGEEVVVVKTAHLLMQDLPVGATSILDVATTVRVGLSPSALMPTRMLDCAASEDQQARPVVVVANRGSQDLSILRVKDDGTSAEDVVEHAVVSLPSMPVRFLPDPVGPTCDDPYIWVVADDGRTFPVDMRVERLGIPLCGQAECAIETRSRAKAGAVGRNTTGRGRVLLGGKGVLAEVGYLRPARAPTFDVTLP